jgi:hypothetical protein
MNTIFKRSALVLAAAGLALPAVPAAAYDFAQPGYSAAPVEETAQNRRDRDRRYDRYERNDRYDRYDRYDRNDRYDRDNRRDRRGYYGRSAYGEPVRRDTRTWRGNDGRQYCQKKDGTTGLIIGAAAGAIIGREVDSRGDRTLGTVLGAAAGALLGKQVAQGTSCR